MMKIQLLLILGLFLSGCATMKDFFGEEVANAVPFMGEEPPLKYSESPQAGAPEDRQYQRMTRSKMEEESDLGSQAGSLWVMEGQTSYLFAQNKSRREGDILSVKLEGSGFKKIEAKANNVRALLKEIEEERKRRENPEGNAAPPVLGAAEKGGDKTAAAASAPPPRAPAAAEKPKEEKIDLSDTQNIQSKIVERLADGSYKIRGEQVVTIDKQEYKVILSGTLKGEDINDQGVSSNKLIDAQYDLVSLGRALTNENPN
jgi:flagellar L-ring protein precursor FlgH